MTRPQSSTHSTNQFRYTLPSSRYLLQGALPLALLLALNACGDDDAGPGGTDNMPPAEPSGDGIGDDPTGGEDPNPGDQEPEPSSAEDPGNGEPASEPEATPEDVETPDNGETSGEAEPNMETAEPEGPEFTETGVCGQRSEGTVTADDFQAFEEFYLLGDEGFGESICVVRFEVVRVGDAPDGCDEFAGQQDECLWTHQVEYQNPQVMTDENGVCANSELGMDSEAIAAIEGTRIYYGYVFEYQGHDSVLMTYDEENEIWEPGLNAGWTADSGAFVFDNRDGFCAYSAPTE